MTILDLLFCLVQRKSMRRKFGVGDLGFPFRGQGALALRAVGCDYLLRWCPRLIFKLEHIVSEEQRELRSLPLTWTLEYRAGVPDSDKVRVFFFKKEKRGP